VCRDPCFPSLHPSYFSASEDLPPPSTSSDLPLLVFLRARDRLQASICRSSSATPNAATAPRDATTSVDVLREFITAVPAQSVPPRRPHRHTVQLIHPVSISSRSAVGTYT
jgi:hypothetical protein